MQFGYMGRQNPDINKFSAPMMPKANTSPTFAAVNKPNQPGWYGADQNYGMGISNGPVDLSKPNLFNQTGFKTADALPAIQPAATPATGIKAAVQGIGQPAAPQNSSWEKEAWARYYAQRDALNANPYGADYTANRISAGDSDINKQFASQGSALRDRLAQQGLSGSGDEVAAQSLLAAEKAGAHSALRDAVNTGTADKAAAWATQQNSAVLDALRLGSGVEAQAISNQGGQIENSIRQATAKYADQIAKAGLDEAQARAEILKYQQADDAWDRANPVAAFIRDLAAGLIQGGASALGRYAGR